MPIHHKGQGGGEAAALARGSGPLKFSETGQDVALELGEPCLLGGERFP